MSWYWIVLLVIAGLVALILVIGAAVPKTHSASRSAVLPRPPAEIWQALTDWQQVPSWRSEVKSVRALDGREGWVETSKFGDMPLAIDSADEPRRLVLRIADDELPFGGTWTYVLEPLDGDRTRLTITEDGVIKTPMFRFMARFVFGYHKTLEGYLQSLGRKFGVSVRPEPPPAKVA